MTSLPPALSALLDAAAGLVRRSSSGRVALARLHGLIDPAALPAELQGWLPRALERDFAGATEPLRPKEVERILREAWGKPAGKVLDDLDEDPLAVTPAAQVHRAELDGAAVAVKVRRPGLAALVRSDLALIDAVAGPLSSVLPAAEVRALLKEVRETALDELDLEHEGMGQRQAGRLLRRVEDVRVPKTEGELCSEDVLVSELLEGPTLATAAPDDPARAGRALVRAHVTALAAGVALTDPRPGHVVLLDDGAIGLLGTGLARPADKPRAALALHATGTLRAGDDAAFAALLSGDLDILPAAEAGLAATLARETLGPIADGPVTLDAGYIAGVGERALERVGAFVGLAGHARPAPSDLGALRMAGQLSLLLARLGAEEDWLALAAD
jgi:hypothetical protein